MVLLIAGLALLLQACDTTGPTGFERDYVVQSYQVAGSTLAPVRLSRTAPVDSVYDFTELAVSDATVWVELLEEEGDEVASRYTYSERDWQPGVYEADVESVVQPLRRYRLRVSIPQEDGTEHQLSSTTAVPDTFRLVSASADTIVYRGGEQLRLTLSKSQYPGRQTIYLFSARALGELRQSRLTPSRRQLVDPEDDLEALRVTTSPPFNESSYAEGGGKHITLRLPWLTLSFFGPHRLTAAAIDDNVYDFIRSESAQQGGSTLAPGEIPNVYDHVEGGTGLFGSYAEVEHHLYVQRSEEADEGSANE